MQRIIALLAIAVFLGSCEEKRGVVVSEDLPHPLGSGFVMLSLGSITHFENLRIDRGGYREQTSGIIEDLDGDGVEETILCRAHTPVGHAGPQCVVHSFANAALHVRADIALPGSRVMAAQDLDGDTIPDLVLATGLDSMPAVAWGLGSGQFSEPQAFPLAPENGRSGGMPMGVAIADVDGDGLLDVVFVETVCWPTPGVDPGRDMMLLLNQGNRTFKDRSELLQKPPRGSIAFTVRVTGPIGQRTILFMNNSCVDSLQEQVPALEAAQAFFVQEGLNAEGLPVFQWKNLITKGTNALSGSDHDEGAFNISHCSPMGEAEGDLNRDGILDWVTTCDSAIIPYERDRDGGYFDHSSRALPWIQGPNHHQAMTPWGVWIGDIDRDGWQDIFTVFGYDAKPGVGPQHVVLLINDGSTGFRFIDQTESAGLGKLGEFMSLAVGDLNHDGKASFIVGGQGEPPVVYLNTIENGNNGFSLRLRGTTSAPNGEGALVRVRTLGLPEQTLVNGSYGAPLVTNAPRVFVATGAARTAGLSITWPSGVIQEIEELATGTQHLITEPQTLRIEPANRHVRADGNSVARLFVTPRKPDGSIDRNAHVEVKISHGHVGAVTIRNPSRKGLLKSLAAIEVEIRSPVTKGESVIQVIINGTPLNIRPRIWWD